MDGKTLWEQSPGFWSREAFIAAVDDAIAQARAEEREACAKVVEEYECIERPFLLKAIAAAIRARREG